MSKFWIALAIVASIFGLALALSQLSSQLVFGFDQARDAFEAFSIWSGHHAKILGPSTDIPGVFHGVLWYYFLAVVYFFGRNPNTAAVISALAFFSSVPLLAILAQKLFKNYKVTALATILYVFSPLFQVFTRWLSNPTLALVVTPLLLLSLYGYLESPSAKKALLSGLAFGLLIQTDFAYGLLLLVAPILIWHFHPKISIQNAVLALFGVALTTASYLIADIKFGAQTSAGLFSFFLRGGTNQTASSVFLTAFDRTFEMLSLTIIPWSKPIIIVYLFFLGRRVFQQKLGKDVKPLVFLLLWLSGLLIFQMVSTAVSGSAHILAAFIAPLAIIFAYLLSKTSAWLILPVVIWQLLTLYNWANWHYSPLSVQRGMFLSSEEKAVDYTYQSSAGQPFIINSVTNPLYVNTLWAYLYEFYGQPKFGYLPHWGGRDQAGLLGHLPQKPFGEKSRFLIIEDLAGIDQFWLDKAVYEEDKVSDLVEEKVFGKLRVQKRVFHSDKGPVPLPASLQRVTPDLLK